MDILLQVFKLCQLAIVLYNDNGENQVLGIMGLVLGVGGGWVAWWAFHRAGSDYFYNAVGTAGVIFCVLGILSIYFYIRQWWISE